MEKRKNFDRSISLLGLGTMRLPVLNGKADQIDKEQTAAMFDYAIENGVNYFDTAYMCHNGMSEAVTGEMLSRYPRESYYLASKMPAWMAKECSTPSKPLASSSSFSSRLM